MTKAAETTLLDLSQVTEPFDLATALKYMKENGEFIRCKNAQHDFYMYRDVQKRPTIVKGRRKFIDVETVWAFNQWGSTITALNVSELFNQDFYIMKFDEEGNPDWSEPVKATEEE